MAIKFKQHLDLDNQARITNLGAPTADNDAVRKVDLDSAIEGIAWKDSVIVASQSNINLSSPGDSIDGITLSSGDRVLIKSQSSSSENGIYVFNGSGSAMSRAVDTSTTEELEQAVTTIEEGTSSGIAMRQTQVNFTLDSDDVLWTSFGTGVGSANETSAGIAEIATQAETDAGTVDNVIVTPLKLSISPFAVKKHNAQFGDGSSTLYTFTHNIGSRHVFAKVFRTASPYDEVYAQIEFDDDNNVSVELASAPSLNEYTLSIIG